MQSRKHIVWTVELHLQFVAAVKSDWNPENILYLSRICQLPHQYNFLMRGTPSLNHPNMQLIDASKSRNALLSLGFAVVPGVLHLVISMVFKSGRKSRAIEYDNFIEYVLTSIHNKFLIASLLRFCRRTSTLERFMMKLEVQSLAHQINEAKYHFHYLHQINL